MRVEEQARIQKTKGEDRKKGRVVAIFIQQLSVRMAPTKEGKLADLHIAPHAGEAVDMLQDW